MLTTQLKIVATLDTVAEHVACNSNEYLQNLIDYYLCYLHVHPLPALKHVA